jgi:hypothetical protein
MIENRSAKAADGVTDLYGVLHRPPFDPGRKYPALPAQPLPQLQPHGLLLRAPKVGLLRGAPRGRAPPENYEIRAMDHTLWND